MRALDVISVFDNLRPNSIDSEQKMLWIKDVEDDIRSYSCLHMNAEADLSHRQEENPELYLDEKYRDLYVYYLVAMSDMANGEFRLYNVSSVYFNGIFDKWKRLFREKNLPQKNTAIKL